jgi:YfiH family protein
LCDYVGDDALRVLDARISLAMQLGIDLDDLIMPRQTHSCRVAVIDKRFRSLDIDRQEVELEGVDALVTTLRGVAIGVNTADCVPIVLADKQAGVLGVVHAGWRGTAKKALLVATSRLSALYAGSASCMQAVIGPCISQKNFEVGQEVYDCFRAAGFPMELISRRYEKWHIDLPLCNRLLLEALGTPAASISDAGICTFDHVDDYFSARRLGISSGRIYTGVTLF